MEKENLNIERKIIAENNFYYNDWKKDLSWQMQVNVKKLHPDAKIPTYAHISDACFDITAVDLEFNKETDTWIYHTGLAFEIPTGYVLLLMLRSSSTDTEVILQNEPSIIDSGYRGEVLLKFKVRTHTSVINALIDKSQIRNNEDLYVAPYEVGERICQGMIIPYPKIQWNEVDELSPSDRGENGYGSTGR